MLAQIREKREIKLAGVPADAIHEESDVDNYSASPIFDSFYASRGSQTLFVMCNFNYNKFENMCNTCCQTFLTQRVNLAAKVKNRCDTERLTFYCPVCLEGCYKLGFYG